MSLVLGYPVSVGFGFDLVEWTLSQIESFPQTLYHHCCTYFCRQDTIVDHHHCGLVYVYLSLLVACRGPSHIKDTRT